MESRGYGGIIQITRATHELVKNDIVCKPKGSLNIKGNGEIEVWYVIGRLNESPDLWYTKHKQGAIQ